MEGLYKANILGKERDIFFGMPAIEYVFEKVDLSALQSIAGGSFKTSDTKVIAHFIYAGLLGGIERKDAVKDFEFSDVYDLVEHLVLDGDKENILEKVGRAFSESYAVKKLAEANKGSKKKGVVKKSSGAK